jgi:hypothetical protein
MEFVEIPNLSITPSKCVFCGSVSGPFVVAQEQTWIEGYGIIAICAENSPDRAGCLVQAARLVGCVDAPVHEKLIRRADYWKDVAAALERELVPLRGLSDAVAKIQADAGGPGEPDETAVAGASGAGESPEPAVGAKRGR